MTSADDFVIQLALDRGVITPGQLDNARRRVEGHTDLAGAAPKLLDLLGEDTPLSRRRAAELLAEEFGMKLVDLRALRPRREVLASLPKAVAVRYRVFPVGREGGTLQIAVSDPLDVDTIDTLGHVLHLAVDPVVAPAAEIAEAIDRFYGKAEASMDDLLDSYGGDSVAEATVAAEAAAGTDGQNRAEPDAPVIKLVHAVILEAIRRRASDIHLEPLEKRFRVRYRIDGMLLEVENPPKRLQLSIISRLKIMANISIAEKRIPQDGRIQISTSAKTIDLRVSSLPTAHGESIVMRILDQDGLKLGLPELGFFSDDQQVFERLITLPDGIFLVTGPTGSGKTTTLYSCLHHLNQPDRKIITVEDPVEYQLTGINQVPVRHDVGMSFASALRAMLRQAPNVIMVGEIRDLETAEIAINASLTGHMVFSTLHTNDAPGAVTRLIDIGVKPFLVSASLRAVMAQRLVRRICRECQRPYTPDPRELRLLNLQAANVGSAAFKHGAGCPECNNTGYRGRMAIVEIFRVSDELQRMIHGNVGTARLRERARALGLRTMREDGVRKVTAGLTTIEEVASVTVGDLL